jgi:hypothetical protein
LQAGPKVLERMTDRSSSGIAPTVTQSQARGALQRGREPERSQCTRSNRQLIDGQTADIAGSSLGNPSIAGSAALKRPRDRSLIDPRP